MHIGKKEKQYLKALPNTARRVADFLLNCETEEVFAFREFAAVLTSSPQIMFVAFACLGTYQGKEAIRRELAATNFLQRFAVPTEQLLAQIQTLGANVNLTVFLADLEPCRTWGWQSVTPEEISRHCRVMVETHRSYLPSNWGVRLWSEAEMQNAAGAFTDAHRWAREAAHPLILRGEAEHIGLFPDILSRRKAREHALIQVASYALEGKILEEILPNAILLQTEFPARRKDQMYQPLRTRKLPVIHPFALGR